MSSSFTCSTEIAAPPSTVFEFFINPESMVRWIGDYAVLDAQPGGQFILDIQGIPVRGQYLVVNHPERIVVSWGHAGSDSIPVGSTEVEFRFETIDAGTRVTVEHRNLPAEHLSSHEAGWPMFLGRLTALFGD